VQETMTLNNDKLHNLRCFLRSNQDQYILGQKLCKKNIRFITIVKICSSIHWQHAWQSSALLQHKQE
jgi:hypothetical protein